MGNNTPPGSRSPRTPGGLTPRQQRRMLELTLSKPKLDQLLGPMDQLLGSNARPREIFARMASRQRGEVLDAPWDKAVKIKLAGEDDAILLSVYGADSAEAYFRGERQLVHEVTLPYQGTGSLKEFGVAPNKDSVDIHIPMVRGARVPGAQTDHMALSARELDPPPPSPGGSPRIPIPAPNSLGVLSPEFASKFASMSPPVQQLVRLELENQVLRAKAGIQEDTSRPTPSKTMQHLQAVEQENFELQAQIAAVQSKVDRTKNALENRQGSRPITQVEWGRSLNTMRKELELCQKRKIEIRRNHEERVRSVNMQRSQFRHEVEYMQAQMHTAPGPVDGANGSLQNQVLDVRKRLEEVSATRVRLLGELREASNKDKTKGEVATAENAEAANPEVKQLNEEMDRCRQELEDLKKELALKRVREHGSTRCQEEITRVTQLREQIEEKQQYLLDERVRTESEVQELKIECSKAKDLLDADSTDVQFLREKAKALRNVNVAPAASNQQKAAADTAARLRQENTELQKELDLAKQTEQALMQTIQKLNTELGRLEEEALRAFQTRQAAESTTAAPETSGTAADIAQQRKALEEERLILEEQELRLQQQVS